MPYKPSERVYRSMAMVEVAPEYRVSGYAATFERYLLYEDNGERFYEQILPDAFAGADMSDVILQYDHAGMVYARTRNGSLSLRVDDHGLYIDADLSLTETSRQLWESIHTGLIDRMSFCFTVAESRVEDDTGVIVRIAKVYDVSAVSIPANPGTDIAARNAWDGSIRAACAERRRRRADMKIRCLEAMYK